MKTYMIEAIQTHAPAERFVLSGDVRLLLSAGDTESFCTVGVNLLTADNELVETRWVGFTKTEADAWGQDDNVLIEMVLQKTGWTTLGEVTDNTGEQT